MSEAEVSQFLCVLIKMGEALQNSGAEVFRVEDTLNRIAAAYGAEEVNIFVITSSIVVTLTMPDLPPQTQTRRLRKSTGNDLLELEQLNALSRRICAEKPPVEEFQQQLSTILAQPGEPRLHLAGSVLAAASFAVFFGGSLWDGVLAGGVAVFICWMERWLAPFCLNGVAFQFIASFLSGMAALLCCRVCPLLHADMVLIGVIMLLVPGIPFTNAIRDILLGDIISGSLRLVEAVLLAAKGDRRSTYFVGDLANIPLADGCCDAVLDVFTPANYAQFGRILKKDGVLIKLAPRPGYLRQLREAAGGRLAAYDGAPVSDYAHAHLNVLEQRTITYTMPVSGALALHLAKMTPMLANIDADSLDLSGVTEITVDETMIVGTIKREEEL